MLLRAMDRNKARPIRWSVPPWDRHTADWLAIDQRLAPDHAARLIDRVVAELDLTDLRKSYAGRGNRPHPPELLLRLVLFESWKGNLSPVQWHSDCQELDGAKWLLFGLQPSLSCFYAFRDRCANILDGFNRQVLEMAQAERLVTADDVALDGSFVSARGSRHRLANSKTVDKRIEQLDASMAADYASAKEAETSAVEGAVALPIAEIAVPVGPSSSTPADTAPTETSPTPENEKSAYWMAKTPAGRFKQRMRYRAAQAALKRKQQSHQQTLSRTAKAKRRPVERITICPTEPEAALGRDKVNTFRPLYNVQVARAINAPFVVGYDVVAEVTDAGQFGPLACRVKDLCGQLPRRVAVDEKYAGQVDLALAEELGIEVYAPTSVTKQADGSRKKPNKGMIPKQEFDWLPEEETYRCPQGHLLKFVRSSIETRQGGETLKLTQYRCPAEYCQECPVRAKCTRTPERGRVVKRNEHDDLVEELNDRMQRPEGKQFYRQRKQTVEPTFGGMKEHRGLRQFRGFSKTRACSQVAALVLAINGMALLKARAKQAARPTARNEDVA
jgi:transposase